MKLRVARARPSEVLDGPALVAFVVAELATRAEVLVRLATVEVETAEFPADAKMLRGAPALADVVRFEVATDALVRNGTTIAATDVARALVRRGPALVAAELPESGAHASVSRGVAVAHVVAFELVANATVRLGLAVLALVAVDVGADAFVRRGLAVFALVARLNVAAAASVMRRRLAICGVAQAARTVVARAPRHAFARALAQALARAVELARKLRDLLFDVAFGWIFIFKNPRQPHALVADGVVDLAPHLLVRAVDVRAGPISAADIGK